MLSFNKLKGGELGGFSPRYTNPLEQAAAPLQMLNDDIYLGLLLRDIFSEEKNHVAVGSRI